MKIIVGLGNPGLKYKNTRHNFGFMAVDALARELDLKWKTSAKLRAEIAKNDEFILVKPATFMNNSGFAVAAALKFFKATADDLVVIHDDLDIDFGKYKIATASRSAGHNGVQSIIDQLGSLAFTRYRLGIRPKLSINEPAEKYVLENFRPEEKEKLPEIINGIVMNLNRSNS